MYVYTLACASGPKTLPVKRGFLHICFCVSCRGGVGWGGACQRTWKLLPHGIPRWMKVSCTGVIQVHFAMINSEPATVLEVNHL